jgi:hypothetical protein
MNILNNPSLWLNLVSISKGASDLKGQVPWDVMNLAFQLISTNERNLDADP